MAVRSVFVLVSLTIVVHNSVVLAAVYVPGAARSEEHFDADHNEHRRHGDEARHGRIAFVPEVGQAWVGQGNECCWEKMDEGRCDEHSSAEMSGEEEEAMWYGQPRKAAGDDRKSAGYTSQCCEYQRKCIPG